MKFEALRFRLREKYMTTDDIVKVVGHGKSYVSQRMSGQRQWELADIYAIMKLLDIPAYQMPAYFTEDGKRPDPTLVRPPLTSKQVMVIDAYEKRKQMQPAVDVLLGLEKEV